MAPTVSVIMAVYNGETYLRQALDSILSQTFTDFEYIIIEDGSTDSTPAILATYEALDSRIRVIHNDDNIGLTRSLNKGLHEAQGRYIARQDSDDISLSQRFAEQVIYLDNHPQVVLLSGDLDIIDAAGEYVYTRRRAAPPSVMRWLMQFYNAVGGHSQVMFRREAALRVGGYAETRRYSQDYDLWLRLLTLGDIASLPRVWLQFRHHQESISNTRFAEQEQLSLADSQAQLSHLLGEAVSLDTVRLLRGFWLQQFPPPAQVRQIHRMLRRIFRHFRRQYPAVGVRGAVAAQFFTWARSISVRRQPGAKLTILYCALAWRGWRA